jgi:hypothetical protein
MRGLKTALAMQPGDVPSTFADVNLIASSVGYRRLKIRIGKSAGYWRGFGRPTLS